MNRVFKVVFNRTTQKWTVASELARGAVKSSSNDVKKPSLVKAVSTTVLAMAVASASVTAVAFDDLELDFEMTDEQYNKNVAAQTASTAPNTTPVTTPSHTVEIDGEALPPATSPTPVHAVEIDGEILAPAPKTEPVPSTPVTPPTSDHNVTIDANPNEVTNPTPNTLLATVAYVDAQNQAQDAAITTKADQSALNDLSQAVSTKADQVTLDALSEKVRQIDIAKATKQSVSSATKSINEIKTQLTTLSEQVDTKADATTVNTLAEKVEANTQAITTKADAETVTALTETVNTKADAQTVNDLTTKVDTKADISYVDAQNQTQDAVIATKADAATVADLTETVNTKANTKDVGMAITQTIKRAEGYADRQDAAIKAIADAAQTYC